MMLCQCAIEACCAKSVPWEHDPLGLTTNVRGAYTRFKPWVITFGKDA